MASIKFLVKTKKNPSNIYLRFYSGTDFDINSKTGLLVNPKAWSNKTQRVKLLSDNTLDEQLINDKLTSLKTYIINTFNKEYTEGIKIDKAWLDRAIYKYNNQPLKETDNHEVYFSPFLAKLTKELPQRISSYSGKALSKKTIAKYNTLQKRIEDFEAFTKNTLRLYDIDLQFLRDFTNYLSSQELLGNSSIKKEINVIKAVCREAKFQKLNVNIEFEHRDFTFKEGKTSDPYLSIDEIQTIFNHDFSENERLDNSRDWLIIGVWTGLRISDIKRLTGINLKKESIEMITKKTETPVIIPLHYQVKYILNKRKGEFPRKISEQKLNEYIKEVCKEANINEMFNGAKSTLIMEDNKPLIRKGKKVFRKQKGTFPKHELVTSHICRRSFATNHYGKLPNRTIMAITGHSTEAQFEKYLKESNMEHVEKLKLYWEQEEIKAKAAIINEK